MRRLLTTTLIASALPCLALPSLGLSSLGLSSLGLSGQAQAQERPSLLSLLTFDSLMQRMVQTAVMGIRTQFDMTYSDIAVDLRTGSISITDLKAWPLPDWDIDGTCEIGADRVTIRGGALDQPDRARIKAQLIGVSFPDSCLPQEARQPLAMAGLSKVEMPRMTLDVDYGFPRSDAVVRLYADITGAAAIDVTANMAYVWFDGRDDIEEPMPVVFLDGATVTLENKGIWEALNGMLPPPLTGEGAPQFIEAALGEGLTQLNRESRDPDTSLTDEQKAFIGSIVETWPAFLATPDTLVLETGIEGNTFVDFLAIGDDPRILFSDLKPTVSPAPSRSKKALPLALITSVLNAPADTAVSAEDKKRVGLALLNGVGAPRNLQAGYDLLAELAKGGDGEAAMAISDALADRVPDEAYGFALLAGQTGQSGATARLDRLERVLSLEKVLELQDIAANLSTVDTSVMDSLAQVRNESAKFLAGNGRPRSYEMAAMFAMIGSAAGDPEAADILAEIDERVRMSGDGAFESWSVSEEKASNEAMEAWINFDLGARYAR